MSLEQNLREMERTREAYWLRYPESSPIKLRWRAQTVRHCFQILPSETILELGAGSGLWTEHLTTVLRGENPITAAVFNQDLLESGARKRLANTRWVQVTDLGNDLPAASFDYVVGTAILSHNQYAQNLAALRRVLKAGGRILFFEANFWNPQVAIKNAIRPIGRWAGNASCQVGLRRHELTQMASDQGFTNIEVIPYDIIHPRFPTFLIRFFSSIAFVFDQTPLVRELCGTLYIWGQKPGAAEINRHLVNLAIHPRLFGSTSIVVPCRNEEMNVGPLVDGLLGLYSNYIHEIIIVNDNSTDRTAQVAREIACREPRVRLLNRTPPNGVGLALRDGYAASTGSYILTMDCDFLQILPELRDLFEVAEGGHDGAIGSRFSYESILVNYPFFKILCNRSFHLLLTLLLGRRIRDISNNLKLYRAKILKNLEVEQPGFAANVETGLKPLLSGYDIKEVPISWINRTANMGKSSFRIVTVAPNYLLALLRIAWHVWRGRKSFVATVPEE